MPVRHPASNPSHLPPRGVIPAPAAAARSRRPSASCVVPVMLAVGIPLTVAGRPGSRSRAFGAGLVLVLAVLGQLSVWAIGYLWLLS